MKRMPQFDDQSPGAHGVMTGTKRKISPATLVRSPRGLQIPYAPSYLSVVDALRCTVASLFAESLLP